MLKENYPHLLFSKNWDLNSGISYLLGQCDALIKAISNTPILPNHHSELLKVSLRKGALATTGIEGNTLSEEEAEKIENGIHLAPSKSYQEIELKNILDAFNSLLQEVIYDDKVEIINLELIKRFHVMVGKNLGEHFDAIPGKFRMDSRFVGTYRCPDYQDVPELMDKLCNWLIGEFHYEKGQIFSEKIIQAIVSHIYIEWIHPFGDGNGRTGRLLEYYILLRAGIPDIASLLLSNHYNLTRSEYYRQIELAMRERSLTSFIQYALLGFCDGLEGSLNKIQESQKDITWQRYIYDKIDEISSSLTEDVAKRRRNLMLEIDREKLYTIDELELASATLARTYANLSRRTLSRDLQDLEEVGLILKEEDKYKANTGILKGYLAQKKN